MSQVQSLNATSAAPAHSGRRPDSRKRQLKVWWQEVDRVLLGLVALLMVVGSIAVAAASPSGAHHLSTAKVHLNDMRFLWLHLRFLAVGVVVMLVTSAMPKAFVRRGAIVLAAAMLFALLLVPVVGTEVNGARRWLNVGISLQPSEFLKPAFVVVTAWILAWKLRDPQLPVIGISAALLGVIIVLLMMQPNLGDAILFVGSWFVLALIAGLPTRRLMILGAGGIGLLTLAYMFYANARHRIDSFLGGGTAFDQVDLASRTLMAGGWTGTGLWLGEKKMMLPEAQTDYIFSVIGEEFGLFACGVIVLLYLAIVVRALSRLVDEDNLFTVLAAAGLSALLGGQAFINILVNLQLFPSKGMTLPLISYGGSSTVAQCFLVGMLLAITRRNPYLAREKFDLREALEKHEGARR